MTTTIPTPLRIAGRTTSLFNELAALHTAEVIRLPDACVASHVQADHLYRSAAESSRS